jgi:hypothetical protein
MPHSKPRRNLEVHFRGRRVELVSFFKKAIHDTRGFTAPEPGAGGEKSGPGNPDSGLKDCISRGITEQVASRTRPDEAGKAQSEYERRGKAGDIPRAIGNAGPVFPIRNETLSKPPSALHPAEGVVCSTRPAIVG